MILTKNLSLPQTAERDQTFAATGPRTRKSQKPAGAPRRPHAFLCVLVPKGGRRDIAVAFSLVILRGTNISTKVAVYRGAVRGSLSQSW